MTKQRIEDTEKYKELLVLKDRIRDKYMSNPNITGIGVGYKIRQDKRTDELSIVFFVRKKGRFTDEEEIPQILEGGKTDVVEFEPQLDSVLSARSGADAVDPDKKRYNPLLGGISIAPSRFDNTAGTCGLVVHDSKTSDPMMLSNYHVMCGLDGRCAIGDEMCQEARMDNAVGWCGNCASLKRWKAGNVTYNGGDYGIDAAVAEITARESAVSSIVDIGTIHGTDDPAIGDKVQKRGRTTRLTSGEIIQTNADFTFDYGVGIGRVTLRNVILVEGDPGAFSEPGDSGSVYVRDDKKKVVGLNLGSQSSQNKSYAVGCWIEAVKAEMNISIPYVADDASEQS